MHAEYTIRALKAGKHVLCEKPMATSSPMRGDDRRRKAADRKLMIAYRCHYEPLNLEAMRRVRSGSLGKPRLVVTNMGRQSDLSEPSDAWRLDMKMSGGGALADMGIYGVNASRYLLNEEPVEVRATGADRPNATRVSRRSRTSSLGVPLPLGRDRQGLDLFRAIGRRWPFEVIGEHKRCVADPGAFYGGNHLTSGGIRTKSPIHEVDQFAREMDWMADVVRGKAPLVSPGEEGLAGHAADARDPGSAARNGAPVQHRRGYRRAVDPAVAVRA